MARRLERLKGAVRADTESFDSMFRIIDGAGWTGEVEYEIERAPVRRFAHIFFNEFESRVVPQVREVFEAAGQKVVGRQYAISFGE